MEGLELSAKDSYSNQLMVYREESIFHPPGKQQASNSNLSSSQVQAREVSSSGLSGSPLYGKMET
jgi:hypothetical protein